MWLPHVEQIADTAGWELIGVYDDQADVLNVFTDSETGEAGRLYLLGAGLDLAASDEHDWDARTSEEGGGPTGNGPGIA